MKELKSLKSMIVPSVGLSVLAIILLSYWSSTFTLHRLDVKYADASERQITRKEVMRNYCLTHSYKTKPVGRDLEFILVDDENKIIYCTIPKVSSTTWKRVLGDLRGLDKNIQKIHSKYLWRWLYQYTEEERLQRVETYFKFLFVREPLHRLLSAYKDKFMRRDRKCSEDARNRIVKAYRPQDYKPNGDYNDINITFAEFIQYFSNDVPRNEHWRQYEQLCHPCVINYDFIGHLETLEDDAPLLLKMVGTDDRVTFPPIHKSTGSDEVLEYYSQVPIRYITRLGELYRSDFEIFGYDYLAPVQPLLNNSEQTTSFKQ
ncbi:carbohydrate sulfotransferase 11-like [Orbicella faveolata]|uniref:carbohydrate sulfotransferase 11-like n=1 Tax=Orbicella faveolata TaxID=48498 RepID=UPI0009E1BBE3|nr:carbohydrate sulfotransferase 11-like [Orbicella faveolata]